MPSETIAIASDHGGFDLKEALKEELSALGHTVHDLGTHDRQSVDYPDYAEKMATALAQGVAKKGILVCGTGIGISIAANRHPHIRAALCAEPFSAQMAREHNDANVLVLGGRVVGVELAKACLAVFLSTPFAGGRHERRVAQLGPRA